MNYIKLFLLLFSLFAVLACGDGSYTADDSTWTCYSPKSAIYNAELYNSSEGASRATASAHTVTFMDSGSAIYEVQVQVGGIITLPDIRAKHCFHRKENQILVGWNDNNDNYTTGGTYKVTKNVIFTSVWEDGLEIYDVDGFNGIRGNLTGTYKLMRNIDLKDYKSGAGWAPIGDEDNFFKGKLYGNGYQIDNLAIDNKTGSAAGLFGEIGGSAEIYDLSINLADSWISLTTPGIDKAVGALAGYIKYESGSEIIIKNIRTAGGVIKTDNCSTSVNSYIYVGGLVGGAVAFSSGGSAKIILNNVSNNVPVSVDLSADCHTRLGGIIGETDSNDVAVSLTFAENYGNINLKDTASAGDIEVTAGGFIGRSVGDITIERGTNEGAVAVSSNRSSSAYSGGIAGYVQGRADVKNSYNNSVGNIFAEANGDSYSGGIVGSMNGGGTITNSHNYDNVTATSTSTSDNAFSGGIVGQVNLLGTSAVIKDNSNTGAVRTESATANSGGIAGNVIIKSGGTVFIDNCSNVGSDNISATGKSLSSSSSSGGIVGGIGGDVLNDSGRITNSRNTDNIIAESQSSASSGGIVGVMAGGGGYFSVDNSSNNGLVLARSDSSFAFSGGIAGGMVYSDVAMSYNTARIYAYGYIAYSGGIAGRLNDGSSAIKNSYNIGEVGSEATTSQSVSGGIAGMTNGKIEKSYNTGDIITKDTGGGIVGETSGSNSEVKFCAAVNDDITSTTSTNLGRIIGKLGGVAPSGNFALETMSVGGSVVNITNDNHGTGKPLSDFQSQSTYETDLTWQFCDGVSVPCNADHPWKMPSGTRFPILYWEE